MTTAVLAPLVAAAVIAIAWAVLRLQSRAQRHLVGHAVEPSLISANGEPSILYFTGAACTVCHTAQAPALRAVRDAVGPALGVREVDVAAEPELARRYRVMSLPTTIVIDGDGTVRHVNSGFASAMTLMRQLADVRRPVAA